MFRSVLITVTVLLTSPVLGLGAVYSDDLSLDYGKIEVIRDQWGIPHVFAETDTGAMYGLGYATAQDRAFQMYYCLRIMQGRVAEIVGDIKKERGRDTAVQHDRKLRAVGFYRGAQQLAERLDPESKGFLQAYSDGVNRYLEENRGKLHYLFTSLNLEPEPWTAADCLVSWWRVANFFATDGLRDLFVYHQHTDPRPRGGRRRGPLLPSARPIVDDSAAVVQRRDVSEEWMERIRQFMDKHGLEGGETRSVEPTPKFSHAWVVGKEKSSTGSAVLVSDPQTPVRSPSLFYEFHIQGKTFNARGVGIPGSPILLIGFTEHVAWGMTALGADQADLFLLKTDSGHPNQYFHDDSWKQMKVWREKIMVKDASPQEITIRETHFGPVVTEFSIGARKGEQVALKRVPMADERDRETIQGALAMMRSKNAHEFLKALNEWRFPSANVVFGDRDGSIGYSTAGAMPIRSANALSGGGAAHDGSSSDHDWQGILPHELHPHVINPDRGYLLSGNHRPAASFFPLMVGGKTGTPGDTDRSRRLRERLQAKASFTPEEVLDIHYDYVSPPKRDIVSLGYYLRDELSAELSPESLQALGHLEGWYRRGARMDLTIPGTELTNLMPLNFRRGNTEVAETYGGGQSGLNYFMKVVSARLTVNPGLGLTESEKSFVDGTLARAWENASRKFGPEPDSWHTQARQEVTARKLGYYVSLDGFPSLDPSKDLNFPALKCLEVGTIGNQLGQAYTQWVSLHDPDQSKTILPIGLSERLDSPYRMSNYGAWAKGELHAAPLSRSAVEQLAVSIETLMP